LSSEKGPLEPSKAAERAIKSKQGAAKFLREVGVGSSGRVDEQVEFILALQKALANLKTVEPSRAGLLLSSMLQQMYSLDVVDEEGVIAWWEDERTQAEGSLGTIREKCKVFVEWLENAEEEDDSDEESD